MLTCTYSVLLFLQNVARQKAHLPLRNFANVYYRVLVRFFPAGRANVVNYQIDPRHVVSMMKNRRIVVFVCLC